MSERVALYVGRWSPAHKGHQWIIDQAMKQGKRVCIAIRDTAVSEKDPYTYEQREQMWRKIYGDKVDVIRLPDIESINIGRKVGYEVNRIDAPEHITKISATSVRGGEIQMVPEEARGYVKMLQTTIWFTGMPCSGKTTIAKIVRSRFEAAHCNVMHLDGDVLRDGLCSDLGFSAEDRQENLRRVANLAKMFNERKSTVLASFVSPTNDLRSMVREIIGDDFILVHVKSTPDECAERDVKGMWAKAKAGEIKGFTGYDAPFEEPVNADLVLDTTQESEELSAERLCAYFGL